MRLFCLATLALLLPQFVYADTATGRVFLDQNQNGVLDPAEQGIADVRVSNGLNVVTTDTQGRYEISVKDPSIVFITKPSGYATPVNQHMLPQFYYIHQPDGSPAGLRYDGIAPTGPLPEQINFPLIERPEDPRFEAILLADTQPQTDREIDFIRDDVIAELIGSKAAFGMTLGDILYDDMSLFPRYNALIAQIGIPWYNVPGNHEINFQAKNDQYSLETFKKFFGPAYYAFEYADALFVVLDNIDYKGSGEADPGDIRGNGGYDTSISREQLRWLAKELTHVDKDRLVFVATHAPLGSENGIYATKNREDLFRLLAGRANLYSVAGHTHTTDHMYFDKDDGFAGPGTFHHHVLAAVSGSWWSGPFDERGIPTSDQRDGTPSGYHILEVDSKDLSLRFKAAGEPADYQMRIVFDVAHHQLRPEGIRDYKAGQLLDGRMSQDEVSAASILVNLFDGGPKSEVSYRIGDGKYQTMQRTLRKDPYILEQFERHRETRKTWVQASLSTHIFSADLDASLPPGIHTVTVQAKDEFGRLHHGHAILEITAGFAGSEVGNRYPTQ
jgi:hypothetical protein